MTVCRLQHADTWQKQQQHISITLVPLAELYSSFSIIIIIIISIRTKSTNTEKQLTQRYRLSAEKEPSAKREKKEKKLLAQYYW